MMQDDLQKIVGHCESRNVVLDAVSCSVVGRRWRRDAGEAV